MARRIFHALMAIYFAATLGAISAQAAERMMIVLDGSGSMWGQIDGEAKISIARRVLKDVLATTPQDLELGLMAYGHREEGQCADIELLVTPAQGTAADIGTAAESVTPLGKTPLSASVREAAEALAFTEQRATVLVITDGIETCNADPCALGAELAQLGVDFTAHVVGFGLSAEEGRQVACLAEETGGLYVSAEDADALADALTDRVTEVAEVLPPEEEVVEETPPELPEASLAAPDTIEIGLSFDVSWEGPGEDRDYIQLFDPAARNGEGLRINARRLVNADYENRSARFVAPVRPGVYDLRYTWGPSGIVIATRPIEVIEASVSLDAPATVDIGARFDVSWVGPGGIRDRVDIIDPSGGPGNEEERLRGARLVNGDFENRTVTMVAPAEPGFYQLQYWNGDNSAVLATREIEVLESAVSLTADAEVAMGTRFIVGWEGPGANRDVVEIFDPAARGGEGEVVGGVRLVNSDYENRQVAINAPATPGKYLLRYWNGDNSTVLATLPLTVVEMAVSLSAPDTILMGHVVTVEWVGPGATRDSVELFDPEAEAGRGKVLASQRIINGDYDARTVRFNVPVRTGGYQLRYWNGDSREVLATRPITVEPMEVSVSGPASAAAGEFFEATWDGPGASRDSLQVFDPDARAGQGRDVASARIINGDYDARTVRIRAPKEPGSYLLRYWSGDWRTSLAEVPIVIE